MIGEAAKAVITNSVSRMFPYIERRDVEQEYVCWENTKYARTKIGMRGKLIDRFGSRKWQNSDRGIIQHWSWELLAENSESESNREGLLFHNPQSPENEYTTSILVQSLMDRLDHTDGQIFKLYFWEGMTQIQIGGKLGISKSKVHIRLKRNLDRWRALISEVNNG